MTRPKKKYATQAEREKHEAALERRRARAREKRSLEIALRAAQDGAEGEVDFDSLLEQERQRQDRLQQQTAGRKGAATSPKVTTKARDDLAAAFEYMGGVPALVLWGKRNPTEFYRIWSRLIPREVAEPTAALPLETLLEKLATKEELSVTQAAREIGEEVLASAKKQVELEDYEIDKSRLN